MERGLELVRGWGTRDMRVMGVEVGLSEVVDIDGLVPDFMKSL